MPVLEIYGDIGENWWNPAASITGQTVSAWLKEHAEGAAEISVLINSNGGWVSEGLAIRTLLAAHPARVVGTVVGFALSAASVVAMGCDEIRMAPGTLMMIHPASGCACGTAEDLEATAVALRKMSEATAGIYAERTGKTNEECLALMDAETWMTPAEAVAMGFADVAEQGKPKPTNALPSAFVNSYRNAPDVFKRAMNRSSAPHAQRKPKAAMMKPTAYALGDRVSVRDGMTHDASHKEGVVSIIHEGPALGITFDGMDMIHRWYVPDEVTAAGSKPESDKSMKRAAQRHAPPRSAPPAPKTSQQPSAARSPFGELAGRHFARLGDR